MTVPTPDEVESPCEINLLPSKLERSPVAQQSKEEIPAEKDQENIISKDFQIKSLPKNYETLEKNGEQ